MKGADVVPAFLAVCPTIGPAWQQYLESWSGEPERGHYNDAGVVAHHIVDSFERGDLSEFPTAFALLERCVSDGDEQASERAVIGIIEDIQNIGSHRSFGPWVFYEWLGPQSRSAWDKLCESWRQVADAKAAGLREPRPDQPSAPQPDPSGIQDPALRRMIESLYRRDGGG
jgi:hypothetical protein